MNKYGYFSKIEIEHFLEVNKLMSQWIKYKELSIIIYNVTTKIQLN